MQHDGSSLYISDLDGMPALMGHQNHIPMPSKRQATTPTDTQ